MKSIYLLLIFSISSILMNAQSEDMMDMKMDTTMKISLDSSAACCMETPKKPVFSIGGRYYFNSLENTRNTLAENGFLLEQEALEYFVQFGEFPKIFYYQQLGSLRAGNYASVTGFGLKKDFSYSIFKNSNFIVKPYVELGAGYYRMNIVKNVNGNSISTVLNATVENYFLDNFVFSGDAGLSLGFNFNIDQTRVNFMVNGGVIGNIPTEWKLAQSLAFREKIQLAGFYAGATVRIDMACCSSNTMNCCGSNAKSCCK